MDILVLVNFLILICNLAILSFDLYLKFKDFSIKSEPKKTQYEAEDLQLQEMYKRIDRYRKNREREREIDSINDDGLFDDESMPSLDDLGYFSGVEYTDD